MAGSLGGLGSNVMGCHKFLRADDGLHEGAGPLLAVMDPLWSQTYNLV
jgi:hypothetical protein